MFAFAPLLAVAEEFTPEATTYADPSAYATPLTTSADPAATGAALAFFGFFWLFAMILAIVGIVAMWKIFTKAGKPGWAAIVPIYNYIILMEIIGRPTWWVVLFFVPLVQVIVMVITAIDLAKSFGKSEVFGVVGLVLFSLIGYLMLGFGDAKYVGPAAAEGTTPQSGATPPPATAAQA